MSSSERGRQLYQSAVNVLETAAVKVGCLCLCQDANSLWNGASRVANPSRHAMEIAYSNATPAVGL